MATLLLIVIYFAFISLGLPDALLGVAWPKIHADFGVPVTNAGIVSMIISGGSIISSFFSARVIKRFGTAKVTIVSVLMTAFAIVGFALCPSFWWLCAVAVPLGLGAGAVDAGLNNFVALHYKAGHMSWLHSFWGIGATAGPVVLSFFIAFENGWRKGAFVIAAAQFVLVFILFLSLPLWKSVEKKEEPAAQEDDTHKDTHPFKLPMVKVGLVSFFCYCAAESTIGLWSATYLVNYKGFDASVAARGVSLFFAGVTIGRAFSGFATMFLKNYVLIRGGQLLIALGALMLLLPLPPYFSFAGLAVAGLGCAPIYPSMLHETPNRFGKKHSQSVMGLQMGFAYIGITFMPPLFGWLAAKNNIRLFPFFIVFYALTMLIFSERMNLYLAVKGKLK
ncbi:fucose permease [Elusimicrobium posterum]|uniref:MFS transporter n=1 Tax=Elusimicrobium posterum TaxID=3116653 RepID=UPI003C71AD67